jgi:hypothetical protein
MTIRFGRFVFAMAVTLGIASTSLRADEIQFATTSELASYNRRLHAIEDRLSSVELDDDDMLDSPAMIDDSCCEWTCAGPGIMALAEVLFLRPYNSDADFDSDSDTTRFKESVRLTLGWTSASGIGVRGRWFEYDINTQDSNFLLQVADAEVTSRIDLGPEWYAMVSGGGRYVEWSESGEANNLKQSLGPMLGLEVGRYLSDNVSLYARGRQALVFGRDLVDNDMAVFATELQLGADIHYALNDRTAVFGRVAWEGQFWTGMATEDSETFGLTGLVFALGMTR